MLPYAHPQHSVQILPVFPVWFAICDTCHRIPALQGAVVICKCCWKAHTGKKNKKPQCVTVPVQETVNTILWEVETCQEHTITFTLELKKSMSFNFKVSFGLVKLISVSVNFRINYSAETTVPFFSAIRLAILYTNTNCEDTLSPQQSTVSYLPLLLHHIHV